MVHRKYVCLILAIVLFILAALWVIADGGNPKVYPVSIAVGLAFFAGAFL